MSVAYSTLTSAGTVSCGSRVLPGWWRPASSASFNAWVGMLVRLSSHIHRVGVAVLAARLAGDRQHGVHRGHVQRVRSPSLGLDPHQRIGVLAAEVVEGRERDARTLVPVRHRRRRNRTGSSRRTACRGRCSCASLRLVDRVGSGDAWHRMQHRRQGPVAARARGAGHLARVDLTVGADVELLDVGYRQADIGADVEGRACQRGQGLGRRRADCSRVEGVIGAQPGPGNPRSWSCRCCRLGLEPVEDRGRRGSGRWGSPRRSNRPVPRSGSDPARCPFG